MIYNVSRHAVSVPCCSGIRWIAFIPQVPERESFWSNDFSGSLMYVSHQRALCSPVCCGYGDDEELSQLSVKWLHAPGPKGQPLAEELQWEGVVGCLPWSHFPQLGVTAFE